VKKVGISISRATLSREANERAFTKNRPSRKPKLTRALKAKRLACATSKLDYPWNVVAFADFKTWITGGGHNSQNEIHWRAPNSKRSIPSQPKPKFPVAVKYFGCITLNGPCPLIEVEETLNSTSAQTLCLEPTIPVIRRLLGTESMLWLDHDPVWASGPTQEYLQDNCDGWFPPAELPARSPDMSIIEAVWGDMTKLVHDANPKTKAALRAAVLKAWTACTTPAKLAKLYDSMPRRMQAVIDAKGAMTEY